MAQARSDRSRRMAHRRPHGCAGAIRWGNQRWSPARTRSRNSDTDRPSRNRGIRTWDTSFARRGGALRRREGEEVALDVGAQLVGFRARCGRRSGMRSSSVSASCSWPLAASERLRAKNVSLAPGTGNGSVTIGTTTRASRRAAMKIGHDEGSGIATPHTPTASTPTAAAISKSAAAHPGRHGVGVEGQSPAVRLPRARASPPLISRRGAVCPAPSRSIRSSMPCASSGDAPRSSASATRRRARATSPS